MNMNNTENNSSFTSGQQVAGGRLRSRDSRGRYVFKFIFFGEGDAAPLTHEVLRRAIEDPKRRPIVHVS
jgi:hypothetical protein